jgi:diphosphomevalonate decarboxylase
MEADFISKKDQYNNQVQSGSITYSSPSNIALVKYWGKKPIQIPANPSISFTLSNCKTTTTLLFQKTIASDTVEFDVFVDDKIENSFRPKIEKFFQLVRSYLPFISDYKFEIRTSNTFPHSSGIASSASGMSAIALCLCRFEAHLDASVSKENELKKASFIARIGSGSACRSVFGGLVAWGKSESIEGSSDIYGVKFDQAHPVFRNYQDTVLLVDKGEKIVSSSVGHGLMENHPYAKTRFEQAPINLALLKSTLIEGNLTLFNEIVESEALTLHAMMMTSNPYFMLFKPNTVEIIQKVWKFREQSKLHLSITLDAGANVHLLYPEAEKEAILRFINDELVGLCQNGQYICDKVGTGPVLLNEDYA